MITLLSHMPPPPEKRNLLHIQMQNMVPNISQHLTKTLWLPDKGQIRQDFEQLTEIQIEENLIKPLQKIGSVQRIQQDVFRKRKIWEQEMTQHKKKSGASGRFARNVELHGKNGRYL